MSETTTRRLWVAYGPAGAVGSIRAEDGGYTVLMAGSDQALGTYPTMQIAKSALQTHLKPGSVPPEYREH